MTSRPVIDDLSSFWMPFTANRQFKAAPRLLESRERHVLPPARTAAKCSTAAPGLWCVNAGHGRDEDRRARCTKQLSTLDFAPTFQMGHPLAFESGHAVAELMPEGLDRIFFTELGFRIRRYRAENRARLSPLARRSAAHALDRPRARLSRRRASAAFRSAASRRTARRFPARCCRPSITCRTRTTSSRTRSRRVSRRGARTSRTNWNASSRCTMRRRLPR